MQNLRQEILDTLTLFNYTVDDIAWIGTDDGKFVSNWDNFEELAASIHYDDSDWNVTINESLVIFMKGNSWFERKYDGIQEWFTHQKTPKKRATTKPITKNNIYRAI